jgi:glycosyltransferase involved in cell wall biosynthesis
MDHNNRRITLNRKLFDKATKKADGALRKNDLTSVIIWSKIAAHFAFVRHPGIYMSPALEKTLIEVAQKIKQRPPEVSGAFYLKNKPKNIGKMRCLHVITESYATGGHSPFVARWIQNTVDTSVHSIIATAQNGKISSILKGAVDSSGGWHISLPELSTDLVEQALLLRFLAQDWADLVVLLVHPFDPIPTVAFGVPGGPPVVYCNHADQAFWLGTSIADVVVDYHSAASEICQKRRGTLPSKILPIPLTKNELQHQRDKIRADLGFNQKDSIMLTVGREEKYYPYENYDYLATMAGFLKNRSNVRLVAAGPQNSGRWRHASDALGGKIQALGTVDRDQLEKLYTAADMYVPSFPCGSGTALLEAAMHKLPIVGLHLDQLPHLSIKDDVGFDKQKVHQSTLGGFTRALEDTIDNSQLTQKKARLVKENVENEHCSPGWNNYLNGVLQSLPSQHKIHIPKAVDETADYVDAYWEFMTAQMMGDELPEHSYSRLINVYSRYLSKADMLNGQAESLMSALRRIDSFKRTRQFLGSFKATFDSAFASPVSV